MLEFVHAALWNYRQTVFKTYGQTALWNMKKLFCGNMDKFMVEI